MLKYILLLAGCICISFLGAAQATQDMEVTMCAGDSATMSAVVTNADSLQWFRNDIAIAGANSDTLITYDGGLYYLRAYITSDECMAQSGDIRVFINQPQANDDSVMVSNMQETSIDVLSNDDPNCMEFDRETITILSPPSQGTVTGVSNGMIVYKPYAASVDADRFTYVVKDMKGVVTNEATVTVMLQIDCALLYPNPVEGVLNVTVSNPSVTALKMYDASGRLVYQTAVNGSSMLTVDMRSYAQGMYMVELVGGKGCSLKVYKK